MSVPPVEALIRQIAALPPEGQLCLRYEDIAEVFPDDTKQEIIDLAAECGCGVKDFPETENFILTKPKRIF
jgi:hypothetical protein